MRLYHYGASTVSLLALSALASVQPALRRDGGDSWPDPDTCQGTQTIYTTVTVWSDGPGGDYEPTGSPTGTSWGGDDYGVGNGGAGATPVIGSAYGGHGLLKPSIIPTATYGPWVIVNGDVHDYSEHGSGPWAAPGHNQAGSGSGSGSGSGYGSGSGSGYSGSGSNSTSGSSSGIGGGYSGSHAGNGTSPNSVSSASHSTGGYTRPSSTASRSPIPPRPSQSGTCKPCAGNTASTRSQWCDYDLQTDYYETVPCTGVMREYFFELTEHIASPDGWPRLVQSINGQIPGPTIEADWGDEVVVHVKNSLSTDSHNGTSLHFHGIHQKDSNSADGAASVTQCPLAPGETYTYRWTATQYGSSWYHSHFGFQAWNGVFGGILINGPASADYDADVGTLTLSDWNHWTSDMLYPISEEVGVVTGLTGLINGTNKWNTSISSDPTSPGAVAPVTTNGTLFGNSSKTDLVGEYYSLKFEAGLSYRLRLVNTAIDSGFRFSIDNHKLTVITTDFVPIEPYETDTVFLNMGQRYDVIVKADQTSTTDYWIRAIPMAACSANTNQLGIKGILHYGSSTSEPTTTAYTYVDECLDEPAASLIPVLAKTVGPADLQTSEAISIAKNADNFFEWTLNGTSFLTKWNNPALLNVYDDDAASLKAQTNLIELPTRGEWFYLLITEVGLPVPHPIHLHGHDFFVLGSGEGEYTGTETVNTDNPPRRDVTTLPGGGWLLLGWQVDNPGVWLMHCHIGWHTLQGFALQFLELEDEILTTGGVVDEDQLTGTCDGWNSYVAEYGAVQGELGLVDSGL